MAMNNNFHDVLHTPVPDKKITVNGEKRNYLCDVIVFVSFSRLEQQQ